MMRNWVAALAAVAGLAVGALPGPHVLAASGDGDVEESLADRIAIMTSRRSDRWESCPLGVVDQAIS
jgi:hypothetical protein